MRGGEKWTALLSKGGSLVFITLKILAMCLAVTANPILLSAYKLNNSLLIMHHMRLC